VFHCFHYNVSTQPAQCPPPPHPPCPLLCPASLPPPPYPLSPPPPGAEHIDPSKVSEVWLAQYDQHPYTERPDMNHIVAGTLFKAHAHW
jgi:hypothetical protein